MERQREKEEEEEEKGEEKKLAVGWRNHRQVTCVEVEFCAELCVYMCVLRGCNRTQTPRLWPPRMGVP